MIIYEKTHRFDAINELSLSLGKNTGYTILMGITLFLNTTIKQMAVKYI